MTTEPKNELPELLPCPFGEDHRLADYTKNNGNTKIIYCDDGDCPIHGVDIEQTAWNTRPAKAVQGDKAQAIEDLDYYIENSGTLAHNKIWQDKFKNIRAALTPESEGIAGKGDTPAISRARKALGSE